MDSDNSEIGRRIRLIRTLRGIKQNNIADALHLTQSQYSNIENGKSKLDWHTIKEIARVFDIDPILLLSFDEKKVLTNNAQIGDSNALHHIMDAELKEQYEKQLWELGEEVKLLKEEIEYLRKLINEQK
ncbi:MAG: helix-turn-helix transcriptional regulator [Chitinophagales bacterium]